jgi:hypothetical protein
MRSLLIVAALVSAVVFGLTQATVEAQPASECQSVGYACFDDGLGPSCSFVCN